MAKPLHLTIESPCHEKWKDMTPTQKGRFCQACEKEVDFTNMSDPQMVAFFRKKATGSVCGRFMNDQLGRDVKALRKRIPWIKYFFQITLPAMLFSYRSGAQAEMKANSKIASSMERRKLNNHANTIRPVSRVDAMKVDLLDTEEITMISGLIYQYKDKAVKKVEKPIIRVRVINEQGDVIAFATVERKGTDQSGITDANGNFELPVEAMFQHVVLEISCVGYKPLEYIVEHNKVSDIGVAIMHENEGGIEMVGIVAVKPSTINKVRPKPKPDLRQVIKDSAATKFRVYPNPVIRGERVDIEVYHQTAEAVSVNVLAFDGRPVLTNAATLMKGLNRISLNTATEWSAGTYSIQLLNRAGNVLLQQTIIIR